MRARSYAESRPAREKFAASMFLKPNSCAAI
jgi:hypothetical protein